jgi:hypothetical protein
MLLLILLLLELLPHPIQHGGVPQSLCLPCLKTLQQVRRQWLDPRLTRT